jgi:hypothetical protein
MKTVNRFFRGIPDIVLINKFLNAKDSMKALIVTGQNNHNRTLSHRT